MLGKFKKNARLTLIFDIKHLNACRYYRSDDTDVEAEEIEAPVYKKTCGVGIIYDPQGTFETESEVREPGRPKNAKRALIKHIFTD
ncbi:hypothetical protein BpHYR1_001138 [Brachionus plicatilis]|uniref:Uncharacterized protein n=1 Tax=Brachionus plicatilis TaxID=10195 RepID=A0A3M7QKB4_BRAPC|nr:hypothetical protein BpHYR1_001138 [Brachionus plicatilis]